MINKNMLIDKAIENEDANYKIANNNGNATEAKNHQAKLTALLQLKQTLQQSGELNNNFDKGRFHQKKAK